MRHRVALVLLTIVTTTACVRLPAEGSGLALGLRRAESATPAEAPTLLLEGVLVNRGSTPFTNGGCTRPSIVIDSLGAGAWVPLETLQSEELVTCIRAFTVDPDGSASFTTTIARPARLPFPRGVILRARVTPGQSTTGPSAEFVLAP